MPTEEKVKTIAEFSALLKGTAAVYVSRNQGLSVAEVTELRTQLRAVGAVHRVVKNTLAARAATEAGIPGLESYLSGPTVVTISKTDIVAPAKVLTSFAKTHEKLQVLGGVVEGKNNNAADVQAIAELPSKEQLVSKLLGSLQAPASRLVRVINGPATNLVRVLAAIADKKAAAEAA
ncbi:MAG TPA: 50S ribosomal protein L10 [bacterium]|jgi:large subunit ribosomal protein L10|nr:50S ribosomal protein L10 [bacterium]